MLTQSKLYDYIVCDSEDLIIKISHEHVMFKSLYIQIMCFHIFHIDYIINYTFTIYHDLCSDSLTKRSHFAEQVKKHMILVVIVEVQEVKTYYRFLSLRF